MSRYDTNPFGEEEINPFAEPSVRRGGGGGGGGSFSRLSPLPPEPYETGATIDIPLDSAKDIKQKEKELKAKEAELKRREQELKRKEDALARSGIRIEEKNWPSFFPIIYNDIANDIPIHLQTIVYVAFSTLIGLFICLLWNIVAVTAAWRKGHGVIIWLLAIIYFLASVPGAYHGWYRPLYTAARTDSALKFGSFFLVYGIHIIFCILAAIAPPFGFRENSLAGLMSALDLFPVDPMLGTLYFVGSAFFGCETLASIWVIQQAFMYFRGSGKAAEMKREAATRTMLAL